MAPPQGMTLRDQQKNYTRNLLLDSAATLIEERGYAQTTIDDIAQAAGTSRATVYAHFGGKDDIARELASQMWARAEAFYIDFAALPDWRFKTVRAWLDDVADVWEADRARTRVVSEARGQQLQEENVSYHQTFVGHLLSATDRWKHVSEVEAQARALTLISQLESSLYAWMVSGYPVERDMLLNVLAQSWSTMLKAAPLKV